MNNALDITVSALTQSLAMEIDDVNDVTIQLVRLIKFYS